MADEFPWHWQEYQVARLRRRISTVCWDDLPVDLWGKVLGMCTWEEFHVCRGVCRGWSNSRSILPSDVVYRMVEEDKGRENRIHAQEWTSRTCGFTRRLHKLWYSKVESLRIDFPSSCSLPLIESVKNLLSCFPCLKTLSLSTPYLYIMVDTHVLWRSLLFVLPPGLTTFHTVTLHQNDLRLVPRTVTDLQVDTMIESVPFDGWQHLLRLGLRLRRFSTQNTVTPSIATEMLLQWRTHLIDLT